MTSVTATWVEVLQRVVQMSWHFTACGEWLTGYVERWLDIQFAVMTPQETLVLRVTSTC